MFTLLLTVRVVKGYRENMGAVERRTRQREELRGQIVAAARQIVLTEGYRALTMRRIAEAVEYSPAAIYQYFESRDGIARALMSDGFAQLATDFEPLRAIADPRERLEAVAHAYIRFGLEHGETYRLMFMEDPEITKSLLETSGGDDDPGVRCYMALIEPVARLQQSGALARDLDVQAVADAFWSALHGFVALRLTCPKFPVTPDEALVPTLVRMLFDGCIGMKLS
jgi:AcrR family transcriptional regulator